jgi:hypothetical protein
VNTPYGEILGMRISSALGQSPSEPQPGSRKAETMALRKKKAFQHESSHCQKDILSFPSGAKAAIYYAQYRSNGEW